jgi:hypothetical protein
MNLVQKVSVGLSLASLMMMSSCSSNDVQAPQPEMGNRRSEANLRGGLVVLPYIAPTNGPTGYDVYPNGWARISLPNSPVVATAPTGVSSLTKAFGNPGLGYSWTKPLPQIPSAPGANSILTFSTTATNFSQIEKRSIVQTTIKNLQVGQKYSVEYYGATTTISSPVAGQGYAKGITVSLGYPSISKYLDLSGKEAEWIKGNFSFTALAPETTIDFSAISEGGNFAYAHIYVDASSIKKVL